MQFKILLLIADHERMHVRSADNQSNVIYRGITSGKLKSYKVFRKQPEWLSACKEEALKVIL